MWYEVEKMKKAKKIMPLSLPEVFLQSSYLPVFSVVSL